jgi:hypothetical protein
MGRPLQYWRSWSLLNARCDVIERVLKRDAPSTQPWRSGQIGKSKTEFSFSFPLFILPSFEQNDESLACTK